MFFSLHDRAGPGAFAVILAFALSLPTLSAAEVPLPPERPLIGASAAGGPQTRPLPPVASDEVAARTEEALRHIFGKRFNDALAIQQELVDPLAVDLVEYFYIREAGSQVPHQRIARFLAARPDWPAHTRIRRLYEVALLVQRADDETILQAFETQPPMTNPGTILFATALAAGGERERVSAMVRELWRTGNLTEGEERLIRQRFSDHISRDDIKFRLDRLLYAGNRAAALRLAKELGEDYLGLAEARLAVVSNASNAGAALDAVPQALTADPVYQLSVIQHERRNGDRMKAARMMLETPAGPDRLADPDAWASERRIAARALVEEGDFAAAYEVIRDHGAQGVLERMDSFWHAGWIALRFLDDPAAATRHFSELKEEAGRPISIARAEYWLGRAAEAAGETSTAADHYAVAASHPTTYYGQLALDRIARTDMAPARKPLYADAARRMIQEREPVRALRLLAQAGYDRLVPGLLMSLAESTDNDLELVGLAEIAHAMGHPGATVHIGKHGTYAGQATEVYAFTRLGIPDFDAVGPSAEPALVYAIARQESLFNTEAVSPAGALGLMQLMPGTARETARTYGLEYSQPRLTGDPAYNAALGSAHLGELIAEFGEAYALVFAAYNAGRSRVYQWLDRFGDPRTGEVDPVDWVEMIPFSETRNYVQRVMEGVQVYRASIEGKGPLRIARDLWISDDDRGDLYIASESENPFKAISEAEHPVVESPSGLGFAPAPSFGSFGFGGGGGGGSTGSFGFGGN
jgi:soluble lytic murein transglycosylase